MKKKLQGKTVQAVVCSVLALVLLASICVPALFRAVSQPDNPIDGSIRQVQTIHGGDALGDAAEGLRTALDGSEGAGAQSDGAEGSQETETPQNETPEENDVAPDEKEENVPAQEKPQPSGQPTGQGQESNDQNDGDEWTDADIGGSTDDGDGELTDGNQGSDGSQLTALDLGLVMGWYKYGVEEKTIVCAADSTVGKSILVAQLQNNQLGYHFSFVGSDSGNATVTAVSVKAGSGSMQPIEPAGAMIMTLPSGASHQNYVFTVEAQVQSLDDAGKPVLRDVRFTIVIQYKIGMDLELQFSWLKANGDQSFIFCGADGTEQRTIKSTQLQDGLFSYGLSLSGESAGEAQIQSAGYRSSSGETGQLSASGGNLILKTADGQDSETYWFTVMAEIRTIDDDGDITQAQVTYQIVIQYRNALDVKLQFTWLKNGKTPIALSCEAGNRVSAPIKHNQLAGNSLMYQLELTGSGAQQGKILSAAYQSGSGEKGTLAVPGGTQLLRMSAGQTQEKYTILVTAQISTADETGKVQTQLISFTVVIIYSNDVCLKMEYTVLEKGSTKDCSILCENQKVQEAEAVYDDQLEAGALPFRFTVQGADADALRITGVKCYQTGNNKTQTLSISDRDGSGVATLLLNGGKTGENTFTVTAEDGEGNRYLFTINIPYKHRGDGNVQIKTNLEDGITVTNETEINLTVEAWTEDAAGTVISHIRANGAETKLTVTLDGKAYAYSGTANYTQQYTLIPKNPQSGDTNEHELIIYAEDEFGNYGEKTIHFTGKRAQAGQKIGTASIYVDLTALGLGVTGPVSYTVLSEEPVSYVVAKAVWGYDAGDRFGTAEQTFDWPASACDYSGTLDVGFYLKSLGDGSSLASRAEALTGNSWKSLGSNEQEILAAIDRRFGAGSKTAILWRCIYRNGISLSTISNAGSVGEFDFTMGSGWMYAVGGGTYYPGTAMSKYYLKDGDVLTLRYTLAYGWDVGGGQDGYGCTMGYCISCLNGTYTVNHQYEKVEQADGSVKYICRCCGTEESCPHSHTQWKDGGDGTCGLYCSDCGQYVSEKTEHIWQYRFEEGSDTHTKTCKNCGAEEQEPHTWKKISDTSTCTDGGEATYACAVCGAERREASQPAGHKPQNQWYHDTTQHWQQCQICKLEIESSRGAHTYVYDASAEDWKCSVCGAWHDWECGNENLEIVSSSCQKIVYHCKVCNQTLEKTGNFEEYHQYVDGVCTVCGETQPSVAFLPRSGLTRKEKEEG